MPKWQIMTSLIERSSLLSCKLYVESCNSTQDFISTVDSGEFYKLRTSKPCKDLPEYSFNILRDSFHLEISRSCPKIYEEKIVNYFQKYLKAEIDRRQDCYKRAIKAAQEETKARYPENSHLIQYMVKYFTKLFESISRSLLETQLTNNTDCRKFSQDHSGTNFDENPNVFQNDFAMKFWHKEEQEYSAFFQRFHIYVGQANYKKAMGKIESLLQDLFEEDRPEITRRFIDFIKGHFEKAEPQKKILCKEDAKLKLLELLTDITDVERLKAKYDVFKDITNMKDRRQRVTVLEQINVSLQGRSPVILCHLAEHYFHETIPIQFLLRNINETIHVGVNASKKPDLYLRRSFHKIFLRREVLKETNNNIFVFDEALPNYLNLTLVVLNKPDAADLVPFCLFNRNIAIVVDPNKLSRTVESIMNHESLSSFSVHQLKVCGPHYMEWRRSWRDVKNLKRFIVKFTIDEDESEDEDDSEDEYEDESEDEDDSEDEYEDESENEDEYENESEETDEDDSNEDHPRDDCDTGVDTINQQLENIKVDEEEVLQYFTNPLNIVSAFGGMGKTTMLQVLSSYCPPNTLALILDLKHHENCLRDEANELRRNPLEYICNAMVSRKDDDFEKGLLHHLRQEGRLIVFIDAFDKVSASHSEVVLSIIKKLQESQVPLWVFTRPIAHGYFEDHFSVIPVSMVDLARENITCYLSCKLRITAEKVEDFLLGASLNLLVVPLYLYMVTKTFTQPSDLQDLNIAELYKRFADVCFQEYMKELKLPNPIISKLCEDQYFENHKIAALLAFIDKKDLVDDEIVDEDCLPEFFEFFKDHGNNFVLVDSSVDEIPIFRHWTYAEYFFADWIYESLRKRKFLKVYEELLNLELEPVRLMLDRMSSKGNPLLLAVLENNFESVKRHCKGLRACSKDDFGRSALHFSLSYLDQSNVESLENDVSMKITSLLLGNVETEQRDDLLNLNCFEYAERCGCTNLIHVAAYWGALDVLKMVLSRNMQHLNRQENNFKWTPLHAAAMNGQVECADYLLKMGADINLKDANGDRPPHCAAAEGFTKMSELFIKKTRASINCKNNDRQTPLHRAAVYGNLGVVKLLLKEEVNVDEVDAKRCTALHLASQNGNRNCASRLLKADADVNLINEEGQTPFYCAGKEGHLDVLKLLKRENAKIDETDSSKNAPIHAALINGHEECALYLLKIGASINLLNKEGQKPLHLAAAKGYIRVIERLKDEDIQGHDSHGNTALHLASWKGHKKCVDYLISKGANVNCKNNSQQMPLHLAAIAGHVNVLKYLAENVSKLSEADSDGNTALHLAALHKQKDSVDILLEAGLNINVKNKRGETPVHLAARIGHVDILECLKERGADMNEIDSSGNTALHLAFSCTPAFRQCVLLLVKAGVDVNVRNNAGKAALHLAVPYMDLVTLLIENHANVNEVDSDGNTALHLHLNERHWGNGATSRGIASYLIEAGTDVNLRNSVGTTPVHMVASSGNVEIMKLLRQKGAHVNVADRLGNTPLHLAIWYDSPECAFFLVKAGADINAQTYNEMTPFLTAASKGHLVLMELFKAKKANIKKVNIKGDTALHLTVTNGHIECTKFLMEERADINAKNNNGHTAFELAIRRALENV